jgi:fatty-acyl-CoA synthase
MPHRQIPGALEDVARREPERVALTGIDDPDAPMRRWSHARLVADVRRAANLLNALSAGQRVRVALLLPPMPETHIALWGAETAGIACPINFQLQHEHVAELVRAVDANILIALGPALRHVLRVRAGPQIGLRTGQSDFVEALSPHDGSRLGFDAPADDTAALFHTGGTTGAPKLARHTHANQLHAAWGAACMYGTRPTDVILNGFPLFHVAGSFVFGLSTLLAGGEVVLPTRTGLRHPAFIARLGDFVERLGVSFLAAVPTVIAGLLSLDLDRDRLRSVRALLTGGSPLPDELAAGFEARYGIPVRNILGMTESAGVISIEPLASPRTPGSCGLALPFTEVVAADPDGTCQPPGRSGTRAC